MTSLRPAAADSGEPNGDAGVRRPTATAPTIGRQSPTPSAVAPLRTADRGPVRDANVRTIPNTRSKTTDEGALTKSNAADAEL